MWGVFLAYIRRRPSSWLCFHVFWEAGRDSIDSCYWKLLRKYCQTITHALFHYSTVCTIKLSTLLLIHHWYCYCSHIIPVIEITWILIALNNNVSRQLTLELRKLIEKSTSVFWVDLGYRLRSRDTVPLRNSGGMTDIPYCSYCYCYWLPSGRTWFSARWLGHGSGYVRNPLKTWTMSPTNQFQ